MRICHVVETAGGGSGGVVVTLAKGQIRRGHEVSVIYSPKRAEPAFVEALSAIEGLRLITVGMSRAIGLHDIRSAIDLYRTMRDEGPFDIIHSHSSKAGALSRLVGVLLSSRQIYTPHAFITMSQDGKAYHRYIERALSYLCDKVIAVSEKERTHGISFGISSHKIEVVSNGIEIGGFSERASARARMGWAESDFIIGFVGRLVPQKNPCRAVEAVAPLLKENRDSRFVIVGDGPLWDQVVEKVAELDLDDRVVMQGSMSAREVIAGFDCVLCTSDYEGLALVMLEALAAGVPILSTPVGGVDEAIVAGSTGLVAETPSTEQLTSILRRFAALTPEERGNMSRACLDLAQRYSTDEMIRKYETVYMSHIGAG